MNPNGKNKISAETEAQVLERFMAGETNITALAKEFGLSRNTVRRIVKSDPDRYDQVMAQVNAQILERFYNGQTDITELARKFGLARDTVRRIIRSDPDRYDQVMARAREEAATRERKRKNEASKKCHQQKRSGEEIQDEHSRAVYEYFWSIKSTEDDYGRYSEFKTAEHFGMSLPNVIEILRTDPRYRNLEEYRECVIEAKMAELQRQSAVSMSKHNQINKVQTVMLNLNAYTANKKVFVYTYPAARPVDMPRRLAVKIPWFDYGREVEEKARKEEWNSETEQKAMEGDKPVPDSEESNGKKKKKKKHKKKKK